MCEVIERMYEDEDKKLVSYFNESTKCVGLIFYHGLGDLIMFLRPYRKLKELYPNIQFQLMVQSGLSFEDVVPDAYFLQHGDMENLSERFPDYDIVAKVHFPMNEHQTELTKGEWCCVHELGIEPVSGHGILPVYENKLVAVHYNITCLPGSANPDEETAGKIWREIKDAGYIPVESHVEHVFHNPVNKKFDFVDCTIRKTQPRIRNLISFLRSCGRFIGVVSGNFHTAVSVLPHNRIMLLEKDLRLECFTKSTDISKINIRPGEYVDGSVFNWLTR